MAYLGKGRREDLMTLARELGLEVFDHFKIIDLKKLIVGSEDYEELLVQEMLQGIINDRKEAEAERRKEEAERRKEEMLLEEKRLAFELERLKLETQANRGVVVTEEVVKQRNALDLHKIMQKYDPKEGDISLYLALFERQAARAEIDKRDWVSHLLGLLPYDITQSIAREESEKADDFEHVKDLLLKRFQLSPENFRLKFLHHQRTGGTWKEFAFEVTNYFNGWLKGLDIKEFSQLKDLIVTEQIKRKVPNEVSDHFIDVWATLKTPASLHELLDNYESVRGTVGRKHNSDFQNQRIPHSRKFKATSREFKSYRGKSVYEKSPIRAEEKDQSDE